MSEKELSEALLKMEGNLPVLPDLKGMTHNVLERDRRSVRRWTVLTVWLWLAAVAMVLFIFIAMGLVMPMQAKVRDEKHKGKVVGDDAQVKFMVNQVLPQMLTLAVAGSVGVLGLAALSTLFLVQASRQATLRQMSASLLAISEQLKQLREAVDRPPAGV
jgi:hypothetical protein